MVGIENIINLFQLLNGTLLISSMKTLREFLEQLKLQVKFTSFYNVSIDDESRDILSMCMSLFEGKSIPKVTIRQHHFDPLGLILS